MKSSHMLFCGLLLVMGSLFARVSFFYAMMGGMMWMMMRPGRGGR